MVRKRSTKIETDLEEERIEETQTVPQSRKRSRQTKKSSFSLKMKQNFDMKTGVFFLIVFVIILATVWIISSESSETDKINMDDYSVKISSPDPYHEVDAGNYTEFIIIVKNTGNSIDQIKLKMHGQPDNWDIEFEKKDVRTKPGSSFVSILNISVTASNVGKSYPLSVTATSSNNPTKEDSLTVFVNITKMTGERTKKGKSVEVDYIGCYATNGTIFDTSIEKVAKASPNFDELKAKHSAGFDPFSLKAGESGAIEGFMNAVVGMKIGETVVTRIPPEQAYGSDQDPQNTHPLAGETLIFQIVLREIN